MTRAISCIDRALRLVFSLGVITLLITYWTQTDGLPMVGLAVLLTGLGLLSLRNLTPSGASLQYRIDQISSACAAALLICAAIGRLDNPHHGLLDALLVAAFAGTLLRAVLLERLLQRGEHPKPRESGFAYARRSIRQAKDLWS